MKKSVLCFLLFSVLMGCSQPESEYLMPQRLLIINGKFFDGKPEPFPCGKPVQTGLIHDSIFGKITVTKYTPMSKEAEEFVIPVTKIRNGEQLLKKAEQIKMVTVSNVCPSLKVKVGDLLPDFSLKDYKGEIWTLNRLRGKRVIINFWHTRCGPCCREIPELNRLVEEYPDNLYLSVAFESADKISKVVNDRGFKFHHLVDDTELAEKIGVREYPFTMIVDENGKITYMQTGTSPVQLRQLEKQVASR